MIVKKVRIIPKMVISLLITLIVISCTVNVEAIYPDTWGEAQKLSRILGKDAAAIYFEFSLAHTNKYLRKDQIEYSNVLNGIQIYMVGYTSNISLTRIIFTSPAGNRHNIDLYEVPLHSIFPVKYKMYRTMISNKILTFDEEGIWIMEIQSNVSNIEFFEYKGSIFNFNNDSKVIPLTSQIKGLSILPSSVVQLIRSAKASEDLVNWQNGLQ